MLVEGIDRYIANFFGDSMSKKSWGQYLKTSQETALYLSGDFNANSIDIFLMQEMGECVVSHKINVCIELEELCVVSLIWILYTCIKNMVR